MEISEIIVAVTLFAFLVDIVLHGKVLRAGARLEELPDSREEEVPVSVVICARNEEDNLRQHLPLILEQEHSCFEVLVVNDGSTDGTGKVLAEYEARNSNLRSIYLSEEEKQRTGKKEALARGIQSAKYDHLLLIDADCWPASNQWIRLMTAPFRQGKTMVLGVGLYERKKKWVNFLIQYETFRIAIYYLGFARWGKPYMGVGRNIAYSKELWDSVGGFEKHKTVASGDDDLFVRDVAALAKIGIVNFQEALTFSKTRETFSGYFRQKKRHLTTGWVYNLDILFYLGILYWMPIVMWSGIIALTVLNKFLFIVLAAFVVRWGVQVAIFKKMAKNYNLLKILYLMPLLEMISQMVNSLALLSNQLTQNNRWQ